MLTKNVFIIIIALFAATPVYSQVAIGTSSPNGSAILEVQSTIQGFLPPSLSSTERDAIPSPEAGLMIYNSTTNAPEISNGSHWVNLANKTEVAIGAGTPSGSGLFGIGTNNPNASALLDLNSSDKGFLPPRMSSAQRDAIALPAAGLIIYNTDNASLEFSDGSDWIPLGDAGTAAVNTTSASGKGLVGLGTANPHHSAALELSNNTKGFLLPRLTTLQRNDIAAPAEGLSIYNSDLKCLQWYNGNGWYNACDGSVELLGGGFTNGFQDNNTCTTKVISVSSCASVTGAALNDDVNTAAGTEYNWTAATSSMGGNTDRALVEIGGQCWFKRSTTTSSPYSGTNSWNGYYNNASSEPAVGEGRLYQWQSAMNGSTDERAQGVCPSGWHIPSDCEWMFLENSLGMTIAQQIRDNASRSTTGEGAKLKSGGSSGFTALLAGFRNTNGSFSNRFTTGNWWTSSQTSSADAKRRNLSSTNANVYRNSANKAFGFSVRCLKD